MSGMDKMKMGFMKAVAAKLKKAADELKQELTATNKEEEKQESLVQDLSAFVPEKEEAVEQESDAVNAETSEVAEEQPVVTDKKTELIKVLKSQDELLDSILSEQSKMHADVKERNWDSLQESIFAIRRMSDTFVELDQQRETIADTDRQIYYEPSVEPLFVSLRTKLTRSKIENEALNTYVSTTKEFISNVIEDCFVKTATTYSPTGKLVKPELGNMLVNIDF